MVHLKDLLVVHISTKPGKMCCENNQRYFRALVGNDYKIIKEIYDSIFPLLKNYIQNNNGTKDDAWDIFQEAIIIMIRLARKGVVLKSGFTLYFMGICKNKWMDHLKKSKSYSSFEEHSTLITHRSILEQELEDQQSVVRTRYEIVMRTYNRLPEKCQIIFKSLFDGDKKVPGFEAAKALGINYGSFRRQKCKCKDLLLEILNEPANKRELNEEL